MPHLKTKHGFSTYRGAEICGSRQKKKDAVEA
jgi:hypothetical protein